MDSAFYSCVDDTIEDAFDASSDTEPADSDTSIIHLQSDTPLELEAEHRDSEEEVGKSFSVNNCSKAADWTADAEQNCLSKDNTLQGNSSGNLDGRKLPVAASLRLRQSTGDNKCSLTAFDNVPLNTDVYHSELSQQRTSQYPNNSYVSKCDRNTSRQSLKSKSFTETAKSHFQMSKATLPSSANHLADTMFLPDDKVMEIVEEQLENDDDDDVTDEDNRCMINSKPVSIADDDDDIIESDDDSDVDEVEEISEDDEDRLADEEREVLEEAARAAAEAEASSAAASEHQSMNKIDNDSPTNTLADDSVMKTGPPSASETPCEF